MILAMARNSALAERCWRLSCLICSSERPGISAARIALKTSPRATMMSLQYWSKLLCGAGMGSRLTMIVALGVPIAVAPAVPAAGARHAEQPIQVQPRVWLAEIGERLAQQF